MPPQITVKQAGGWAAWVKLTGWVDPQIVRDDDRRRRAAAARELSFTAGAYRQAVRYYSRLCDRGGRVLPGKW